MLLCDTCYLVQLKEYISAETIFSEYAYFSSFSTSWVAHAKAYCESVTKRLGLGAESFVVELASNDGYSESVPKPMIPLGHAKCSAPARSLHDRLKIRWNGSPSVHLLAGDPSPKRSLTL